MTTDKRKGWLLDLKVGDKVACDGWGLGRNEVYVGTVESITPTGFIRVKIWHTPDEFRADGKLRRDGTWDSHDLVQLTPEVQERIDRQLLVEEVSRMLGKLTSRLDTLSSDDLKGLVQPLRSVLKLDSPPKT